MYPTSQHPAILFLPPVDWFHVDVRSARGKKRQTFVWGRDFFFLPFFKRFMIPSARRLHWSVGRRASLLLRHGKLCGTPQRRSLNSAAALQENWSRKRGEQLSLSSIFVHLDSVQPGFLTRFHRKVKAHLSPKHKWNILVGNYIKLVMLRIIKTGELASELKK